MPPFDMPSPSAIPSNDQSRSSAPIDRCPCRCAPGRKYAGCTWGIPGVVGAGATIKTRYGTLCCESCASDLAAYQTAHVSLADQTQKKWGQVGWGRERVAGSTVPVVYRYGEMMGHLYRVWYQTLTPPQEGSEHVYRCDLDNRTGTWTFSQDGLAFCVFSDEQTWGGVTGASVFWGGEIYNKEDDMPGTAADKCRFTHCVFRIDGKDYDWYPFTQANAETDDPREWGILVEGGGGTTFSIWDKRPGR